MAAGGGAASARGTEVGRGAAEIAGAGVGLTTAATGGGTLALGSDAGQGVLGVGRGDGDSEGDGVSGEATGMLDSDRKHGLKGSLQQAGLAGQVRAGERRSSRQVPPQQNVPLMQQSGLQGLLLAAPDSSRRASVGGGGGARPVSTAKPLLSEVLPWKLPSVPMGSGDAASLG